MPNAGVSIRPALLWSDEPEIVRATLGLSVATLKRYSRRGLTMYTTPNVTRKKHFWKTDEVLAYLDAISTANREMEERHDP